MIKLIFFSVLIMIIVIIITGYFAKTDIILLYNYLLNKNAYINNEEVTKIWNKLNDIMNSMTNRFNQETGTNFIPDKMNEIYTYFRSNSIKCNNIIEIGFNGGHSCAMFLVLFPKANITVFDLGEHKYTKSCFDYLDSIFPNRLTLITGDSTKTFPNYINEYNEHNKSIANIIIHVDGGHYGDIPKQDLENSYKLLSRPEINKGFIIFDDTWYRQSIILNFLLKHCRQVFNDFVIKYKKHLSVVKKCNGSTLLHF